MVGNLSEVQVQDIFDEGLHEFLGRFMGDLAALGGDVQRIYLSGETR